MLKAQQQQQQQYGWCWGGNWGPDYFDSMHFEKTDGGCSTTRKLHVIKR